MASAVLKMCKNCQFKSGEGTIIICNNKYHFGMAMRETAVCDSYQEYQEPIIRFISDTVAGVDAGG